MNNAIAVKQTKRQSAITNELVFLITLAEYARKHDPDFDYASLFKQIKDLLK